MPPRPRSPRDAGRLRLLAGLVLIVLALLPWLPLPMWARIALIGVGMPVALVYGLLWPANGGRVRETGGRGRHVGSGEVGDSSSDGGDDA